MHRSFIRISITVLAVLSLSRALASASPFQLKVQPIQVCDDNGLNCANNARTLYEAEGDKIWAQAGIDLAFLPWATYNETDYLAISAASGGTELIHLWIDGGHGENLDSPIVNMWFVNSLFYDSSGTTFGAANLGSCCGGYGFAAISDATFANNRRDTIAHELGHTLGLDHYANQDPGIDLFHDLMTAGSFRGTPGGLGDIYPDGAGLDRLSSAQLAIVLQSDELEPIPEPASLLLLGTGLVWCVRRGRRGGPAW